MKDYQVRPNHVADSAWRLGYMTPLELFRVAAWKSAKNLAELTLNSEDDIMQYTRDAIDGLRAWKGRAALRLDDDACWEAWRTTANSVIGVQGQSGLLALQGVGYRVATAILCILDPEVWPVIDRFATETVFGRPLTWYGAAQYTAYTRHLATKGHDCWPDEPSIHTLDRRAMITAQKKMPLPEGWTYAKIPKRSD